MKIFFIFVTLVTLLTFGVVSTNAAPLEYKISPGQVKADGESAREIAHSQAPGQIKKNQPPAATCTIVNPTPLFPITCGAFSSDGQSLIVNTPEGEGLFEGACINGLYTKAATGESHEIAPNFMGCYGTPSDKGPAGDGQVLIPLTGGIYGQYGLCYNAVGSGNTFQLTEFYPYVSSPDAVTPSLFYAEEFTYGYVMPQVSGLENLTFTC